MRLGSQTQLASFGTLHYLPSTMSLRSKRRISGYGSDVFQGERRPPTFFTRGTASPLLKSNVAGIKYE
jgi:hypothetical protein